MAARKMTPERTVSSIGPGPADERNTICRFEEMAMLQARNKSLEVAGMI
jgi:hypothetical protein